MTSRIVQADVLGHSVAAIGSLMLHAAFILPLFVGRGDLAESGIVSYGAPDGRAEGAAMVLIQLNAGIHEVFVQQTEPDLEAVIVTLEPLPNDIQSALADSGGTDSIQQPELPPGDSPDATDFIRLRGLYHTQVWARLERVWEQANPGDLQARTCVAEITQREDGTVLEVELVDCQSDPVLQRSIASAVFRSSPLPLPPDSRVFTAKLRIAFLPRREYAIAPEPLQAAQ